MHHFAQEPARFVSDAKAFISNYTLINRACLESTSVSYLLYIYPSRGWKLSGEERGLRDSSCNKCQSQTGGNIPINGRASMFGKRVIFPLYGWGPPHYTQLNKFHIAVTSLQEVPRSQSCRMVRPVALSGHFKRSLNCRTWNLLILESLFKQRRTVVNFRRWTQVSEHWNVLIQAIVCCNVKCVTLFWYFRPVHSLQTQCNKTIRFAWYVIWVQQNY
jgi:hypothetical protein